LSKISTVYALKTAVGFNRSTALRFVSFEMTQIKNWSKIGNMQH